MNEKSWVSYEGFKITKITVLLTEGTDKVSVYTTLPSPFPPAVSDQPLCMDFAVQCNKGVQYVRNNFGMEPEVIDSRSPMVKGRHT
jgi:hypothetical protein